MRCTKCFSLGHAEENVQGRFVALACFSCRADLLPAARSEVWFVEEQDLLALALEGRYVKHVAPLTCPRSRWFGG